VYTIRTGVRLSTDDLLPIAGQPPPERADAARNRARILEAVRELLVDTSPCEISTDAVATLAGVGKGTIYRRFGDRGGLMQAVLDDRERAFQQAVLAGAPPLGPGAPPADRLAAFLCALVDQLEEIGDLMAEVESGVGWMHSPPYQFRRMHVRMLLAEARPDLDADPLTDVLLAPLAADVYRYQRREAGHDPQRIQEAVRAMASGVVHR
jgi:AcrR family transcriptional regulator